MNRLTRIVLTAGLASALMLSITAAASANTVTIGSALAQIPDSSSCIGVCTAVQQEQAAGSQFPLTSPANGVVTEWAFRATDSGALLAFRILRPAGANTYEGLGTAPAPAPDSGSHEIVRYPTSLAIKQGDAIGISGAGDLDAGLPQHDTPTITSNVWATNPMGQPADGTTASFTPEAGHELLLQATVKFCAVPNVHKLKKVNAKQALANADCGVKVKKKETHKKKFRGKVLKQKKAPGTTGAPGLVVPIVIGQK
jgi:hypothetical protein